MAVGQTNYKYTIQYTCHAFREFLKECSVTQSFATPGTPTENAVCEAFFSRMKYEALYRQTYSSIEEIDEEVSKYIDYYNNRRPHRRLNFKSPSEIEAAYYASLKT
jgi:transposase InsO family protein